MKKWWVFGLGSGYVLTALLMLADEEYVFLHGSELAPFFEFFLWSYSLLSGLAVGILVWRKVAGRSQLAAVLVAALSGFLVSAFQFYALVFWALTVLVPLCANIPETLRPLKLV